MLEDDEHIEGIYRQQFHFAFAKMFAWGGLLLSSAAIIYFLYPYNCETAAWSNYAMYGGGAQCPNYPDIAKQILFIITWGLVLTGIFMVLKHWLKWHMNAIVMTSANLMFVDWKGPLKRECTRIDYWNLDEITVERKGLKAWAYGYGTLHFSKVNGGEFFKFTKVPRPDSVAKTIESYKEQIVHNKNFSEETALKDLLVRLAARHVDKTGLPDHTEFLHTKMHGGVGKMSVEDIERKYWTEQELRAINQKAAQEEAAEEEIEEEYEDEIEYIQPEETIITKEIDDEGGLEIHVYK